VNNFGIVVITVSVFSEKGRRGLVVARIPCQQEEAQAHYDAWKVGNPMLARVVSGTFQSDGIGLN